MNQSYLSSNKYAKPYEPNAERKAGVLLDLREALYREEYERCGGLIQEAKSYGAQQNELRDFLADCVSRGARAGLEKKSPASRF